jgi:hypothetical protein
VAYRITVTPPSATNNVNVPHTFTVLLEQNTGSGYQPLSGQTISLSLTQPAGDDAHFTSIVNGTINPTDNTKGTCTTDATGKCTATIVASKPGLVTLNAEFDKTLASGPLQVTGSATKQYNAFNMTITPGSATNDLNQPHTFTITLTRDTGSGPVGYAGQTINLSLSQPTGDDAHFTSIPGGTINPGGTTGSCTTDANGQCTATIVASKPGTVTLTATWTSTGLTDQQVTVTKTATKTYLSLSVSKKACATVVPPGGLVRFDIPWSVAGASLTNARIVDHLQSPMLFSSGTPTPNSAPAVGSTGDVTWNLANPLPDPSSGSVSLVVSIAPGTQAGTYTNHGDFLADGGIDRPFTATITVSNAGASASGEAYGATASIAGTTVLPKTPDVTNGSATLISLPANPVIALGILSASNTPTVTSTKSEDNASATVANLDVELPGLSVKADVVTARSDSIATGSTATTLTNGSEVLGLSINGTAIGDVSSPRVIPVVNGLGVKIAEVDVLENTGAIGAAIGGAAGAQPQGGLFSSGLTVNGIHVKLLQAGPTAPPTIEAIVSHAQSVARYPTLTPCAGTGPYVVGEANLVHEVLTYPTGPTTVLEGEVILPSTGGDVTSAINNLGFGGMITSGTGNTQTKGALTPLNATSNATVQNLVIPGLSLTAVTSSATANPGAGGLSGTTTILKLVIGTTNVCEAIGGQINKICSPTPNTVLLDITRTLKIELNEQIVDLGNKVITVNAVHIWVLGPGNPLGLPVGSDLTISSSTAGTS